MIQLHQFLITDGVTTLDLQNNIDYQTKDYTLPIPALQPSALAGTGPYIPVVQSITLDILGDSPALCWEKFATLLHIIAQAEYWTQNQPINAVRLIAQTTDTAPVVAAYILNAPSPDEAMASYSADLIQYVGGRYSLSDVVITFRRTVWEWINVEASAFTQTAANPGTYVATWATNNPLYSRMRVAFAAKAGGVNTFGATRLNVGAYILMASSADKISIIDSIAVQENPAYNVTDTTNNALGGSVKRIDASTTPGDLLWYPPTLAAIPKRALALYAAVRNNGSTATFTLSPLIQTSENDLSYTTPPLAIQPTIIDASTNQPRIVFLGVAHARFDLSNNFVIKLQVTASVTDAAQSLDIDYLVMHVLDDPWTDRSLVYSSVGSVDATVNSTLRNLVIDPGSSILPTPYPVVVLQSESSDAPIILRGDTYLVSRGASVACTILSTNGDAKWRLYDPYEAQVVDQYVSLRRTPAYLVPPGE